MIEEFGPGALRLVGDPKLLSQVLDNLLSNAIKYSPGRRPHQGRRARRSRDSIAIIVEDNGIGIPAQDIDRLFERYFRGSNVSGIVGTGVGLNLVKMVVDLHGGNIAVESTEGEGIEIHGPFAAGSAAAIRPAGGAGVAASRRQTCGGRPHRCPSALMSERVLSQSRRHGRRGGGGHRRRPQSSHDMMLVRVTATSRPRANASGRASDAAGARLPCPWWA